MLAPYLGPTTQKGIVAQPTATPAENDNLDNPVYTGRYFMIFGNKTPDYRQITKALENATGAKVASTADFTTETFSEEKITDADVLLYNDLGIALLGSWGKDTNAFQASINDNVLIEPELVVYCPPTLDADTLGATVETWGLDITRTPLSAYSGRNVPVAVLDTGFDFSHPDFAGRTISSQSFVPGLLNAQDVLGHGTHCIGTACGNIDSAGLRYGIAHKSRIYVGKVLGNNGNGAQGWIINGMGWAANNGCKVISMSLGSPVLPFMSYSAAYEASAANALSKGAIVVAAAGNDSKRKNIPPAYNPVRSPANCPSVIAVGALGKINPAGANVIPNIEVGYFSNRSINQGQNVAIAAPGVNVYSSWPMLIHPNRYNTISGTSMATPHVAGLLALLWEKYPNFTPTQIITEMYNLAQALPTLMTVDIGAGLATAP